MTGIENRLNNFDQFNPSEEIVEGIREVLGNHAVLHHTVQRPDYHNMIYGGLHENRAGAVEARKKLANKELHTLYGKGAPNHGQRGPVEKQLQKNAAREWDKAPIIRLKKGQVYHPWGERYILTHGVDDGTHGSKKRT